MQFFYLITFLFAEACNHRQFEECEQNLEWELPQGNQQIESALTEIKKAAIKVHCGLSHNCMQEALQGTNECNYIKTQHGISLAGNTGTPPVGNSLAGSQSSGGSQNSLAGSQSSGGSQNSLAGSQSSGGSQSSVSGGSQGSRLSITPDERKQIQNIDCNNDASTMGSYMALLIVSMMALVA